MQEIYHTPRLLLNELKPDDAEFIKELVNSPGWLKYIGDRNVKTAGDAKVYVKKILDNPAVNYRVVRLKDGLTPIGIITFIKRNYLDHHDIGFAFLPEYAKWGYAIEATQEVLNNIIKINKHVLATTIRENKNSIQLLEKLGFMFKREIENEKDVLLLYSITGSTSNA
jgi:[ribosomal protein S5]-alanine N-acetyltransferase